MVAEFSQGLQGARRRRSSPITPYNEKQSSYQAEVTAAMAGSPDGLYLVSYPVDGATIARALDLARAGRRSSCSMTA